MNSEITSKGYISKLPEERLLFDRIPPKRAAFRVRQYEILRLTTLYEFCNFTLHCYRRSSCSSSVDGVGCDSIFEFYAFVHGHIERAFQSLYIKLGWLEGSQLGHKCYSASMEGLAFFFFLFFFIYPIGCQHASARTKSRALQIHFVLRR